SSLRSRCSAACDMLSFRCGSMGGEQAADGRLVRLVEPGHLCRGVLSRHNVFRDVRALLRFSFGRRPPKRLSARAARLVKGRFPDHTHSKSAKLPTLRIIVEPARAAVPMFSVRERSPPPAPRTRSLMGST